MPVSLCNLLVSLLLILRCFLIMILTQESYIVGKGDSYFALVRENKKIKG